MKQRREITNGSAEYVDQAPVRAALEGKILILDGIEKAERNVLPTLNNLLGTLILNLVLSCTLFDQSHLFVFNRKSRNVAFRRFISCQSRALRLLSKGISMDFV